MHTREKSRSQQYLLGLWRSKHKLAMVRTATYIVSQFISTEISQYKVSQRYLLNHWDDLLKASSIFLANSGSLLSPLTVHPWVAPSKNCKIHSVVFLISQESRLKHPVNVKSIPGIGIHTQLRILTATAPKSLLSTLWLWWKHDSLQDTHPILGTKS